MSLWFAGEYSNKKSGHSWGTLTSADNGLTWTQKTIEKDLPKNEWPTEQCMVHLGNGRILAIARSEGGAKYQFQLTSTDGGSTWKREKTNICDVRESTPSLFYDPESKTIYNYYYQRGRGMLKRRVAKVDEILGNPLVWQKPEIIAFASAVGYDAGNVNATFIGDTHYLAYYSGDRKKASVVISSTPAPKK